MKGNTLLLSILLLSSGAICAMDDSKSDNAQAGSYLSSIVSGAKGFFGGVYTNIANSFFANPFFVAKNKVTTAWRNRPSMDDVKGLLPTLNGSKNGLNTFKERLLLMPTVVKDHKWKSALLVGSCAGLFAAYKAWKKYEPLGKRMSPIEGIQQKYGVSWDGVRN